MKFLAVIPARGGSKGIPRKNVRLLAGKPLIGYCIETALDCRYSLDIAVSTDDQEIARVAASYGVHVIMRPESLSLDMVTLDPVIYHAMSEMENFTQTVYDTVITMQPTSPLLKKETLDAAVAYYIGNGFDTIISGINKPHLSWTEKEGKIVPAYTKRENRQNLPKNILETGSFIISKRKFVLPNSRFGTDISIFEIPKNEAVDIDSPQDWWIAEKELSKKNILLRVDGCSEIGLGHIYRGLQIAYEFIDHDIFFVLSEKSDLGIQKIRDSHFPYVLIKENSDIAEIVRDTRTDIIVNDILDTDKKYMSVCRTTGARVINFEDLGEGVILADAVINDLYEQTNTSPSHYWGSDYYCIRDEFLLAEPSVFNKTVKEVLIIFGGTDPCNLTQRLLDIISETDNKEIHYTIILGIGYGKKDDLVKSVPADANIEIVQDVKLMTEYMRKADLAVSSQGRTMLELASMEVPTILLAQNQRELGHEFGYWKNGFINLGLGSKVENDTITQTLLWLINSPQIRYQMKEQMKKKELKQGMKRVRDIILGTTDYIGSVK